MACRSTKAAMSLNRVKTDEKLLWSASVSPVQFVFVVQSTVERRRTASISLVVEMLADPRCEQCLDRQERCFVQDALPNRQPVKRLQQRSRVSDQASLTHDPCQIVLCSL